MSVVFLPFAPLVFPEAVLTGEIDLSRCGGCPSCLASNRVDHDAIGGEPDRDCPLCDGSGVGRDDEICRCVVEWEPTTCECGQNFCPNSCP